ncbi:MAG: hypothetical protein ACM31O_01670 [Bacteroidota bacterium]
MLITTDTNAINDLLARRAAKRARRRRALARQRNQLVATSRSIYINAMRAGWPQADAAALQAQFEQAADDGDTATLDLLIEVSRVSPENARSMIERILDSAQAEPDDEVKAEPQAEVMTVVSPAPHASDKPDPVVESAREETAALRRPGSPVEAADPAPLADTAEALSDGALIDEGLPASLTGEPVRAVPKAAKARKAKRAKKASAPAAPAVDHDMTSAAFGGDDVAE